MQLTACLAVPAPGGFWVNKHLNKMQMRKSLSGDWFEIPAVLMLKV